VVEAVRTSSPVPEEAIVGQPASPGRATGPVRIVYGPADFDRFQSGEVLAARATAPASTPLFARAVAVVTDGGTLAAHTPWSLGSLASPQWSPLGTPPSTWPTAKS
jgi:rifampicin phosphotransferase